MVAQECCMHYRAHTVNIIKSLQSSTALSNRSNTWVLTCTSLHGHATVCVCVCVCARVCVKPTMHTQGNFCCWRQESIIVRACCAWNITWYIYSTSHLEIDRRSILKQVECTCSIRYFHAQHPQTIMLPCCQQQKLPRVWLALGFSSARSANVMLLQVDWRSSLHWQPALILLLVTIALTHYYSSLKLCY